MVIHESLVNCAPEVKWIGCLDSVYVPSLEHKNIRFYKKCLFDAFTLTVGDYILVSNADSADPDTIEGCDIARILYLYELREPTDKDPHRAIVQWYSRPQNIPHREFDNDEICIDFNLEIIEDHRAFDSDISLETIYRKCGVIPGPVTESAAGLLHKVRTKSTSCPMFVCRYKLIKVKKLYRLVPLEAANETVAETADSQNIKPIKQRRKSMSAVLSQTRENNLSFEEAVKKSRVKTPRSLQKRPPTMSSVEFIDINEIARENKVSPIKIIGGKSVVRLSAHAGINQETSNYYITSPLAEKNIRTITPTNIKSTARRNLNLSLENGADTTADSADYLDYSIVKNTPDHLKSNNDIKIKLRVSDRKRSIPAAAIDDPLYIDNCSEEINLECPRKRLGLADHNTPHADIYSTPSKKSKDHEVPNTHADRRKSILKSASSRAADGTPKRNIQLSDVVEKRIFQNDDIIHTPKRVRSQLAADPLSMDCAPAETPSKKTPSKGRRSSKVFAQNAQDEAVTMTPSRKLKQIRSGDLTPSITERKAASIAGGRKSDLQKARESLHVSVVPSSLPCRENEFNNIYTFLEGKIQDECGGCMYVSGVPGTGKTATVTGVIRMLQLHASEEKLPNFEFVEINGMRLTEPRQAYVQIYKQLTGKTLSWEHAHSLLEKRFTTSAPRRVTTVLLVDELDILCNRRQDVVYNLLDWPSKSAARLVVVTIANTMDLPERLLMGKVTSRLGLTRLTFQPYTHKQLQEIVTARLGGNEAFKSDAVQLVARKVAAVSGDARRALDICRRSTEIADSMAAKTVGATAAPCVNMIHVQQALTEMIASAKVQAIKNCSRLEQIFLQAIVAEVTRTGVEETSFLGIYTQMETIAPFLGATVPTTGHALKICSKLGAQRLIICEHSRNDIFQKVLLNVSMDDIHYALKVNN